MQKDFDKEIFTLQSNTRLDVENKMENYKKLTDVKLLKKQYIPGPSYDTQLQITLSQPERKYIEEVYAKKLFDRIKNIARNMYKMFGDRFDAVIKKNIKPEMVVANLADLSDKIIQELKQIQQKKDAEQLIKDEEIKLEREKRRQENEDIALKNKQLKKAGGDMLEKVKAPTKPKSTEPAAVTVKFTYNTVKDYTEMYNNFVETYDEEQKNPKRHIPIEKFQPYSLNPYIKNHIDEHPDFGRYFPIVWRHAGLRVMSMLVNKYTNIINTLLFEKIEKNKDTMIDLIIDTESRMKVQLVAVLKTQKADE